MAAGANDRTMVFVYGTLKRGGTNHGQLADQRFVAEAHTAPGFTLYALDGYPGMVADAASGAGVSGELWSVTAQCLARLDNFEGVAEGLYRREFVPLVRPLSAPRAQAYLYARSVAGCRRLGSTWPSRKPPL